MSLIPCPECGTDISERATKCPYCGFQSEDPTRPISEQDTYQYTQDIYVEDELTKSTQVVHFNEHNKTLYDFFGNWVNLKLYFPDIAKTIWERFKDKASSKNPDTLLVADIDALAEETKKMLASGEFKFMKRKKDGVIVGQIVNSKNRFKEHVPLKEIDLKPEVVSSLNHLFDQAQIEAISHEIKELSEQIREVSEQIKEVRVELKNDRLAKIDSAIELLYCARMIKSKRIREMTITQILAQTTQAKNALMKDFVHYLENMESNYHTSLLQTLFSSENDNAQDAQYAFETLQYITKSVLLECNAYSLLGEYQLCEQALKSYKSFITIAELNNKDTMLMINEFSQKNCIDFVERFDLMVHHIDNFKAFEHIALKSTSIPLPSSSTASEIGENEHA